jgi:hypothetical protein
MSSFCSGRSSAKHIGLAWQVQHMKDVLDQKKKERKGNKNEMKARDK